ncbi:MAG: YggS family pyridoxal phosphate-dependent enzyme [Planctomycetaceae bacterium]
MLEPDAITAQLITNLRGIQQRILNACLRSSRDQAAVHLIAVTKYAAWPWVESLAGLHSEFGENRPQQLSERQPLLPQIHWHLIGQLQRNKVRLAVRHASMIHSVDSLRLLEAVADAAHREQRCPRLLLQVNASLEAAKSGFHPDELPELWPQVLQIASGLPLVGLMTMAAETVNSEEARPAFHRLRLLRDALQNRADSEAAKVQLLELSMGMSGDFEVAIEEGATLIRLGTAVFCNLEAT